LAHENPVRALPNLGPRTVGTTTEKLDDSKWVEAGLKEKKEVKSAKAISDDKAQRLVA
jgi:hypothetical protein